MDSSVGQLMDAIRKNGFENNTIVFFTNDNGGSANGMGDSGSSNHPLRGELKSLDLQLFLEAKQMYCTELK